MTSAATSPGWSPTPDTARRIVSVTLRGAEDGLDEEAFEAFRSRIQRVVGCRQDEAGQVELTFTHDSDDLWITLLTAMNASWAAGYEPVAIAARPAAERRSEP